MQPCGYPGDQASARQPGPLDFGPSTDFAVLLGLSAWLLQSYPQRQQENDASKGSGHTVPSASILQRRAGRALGHQGGPPPSNRHGSCNTQRPPSSRKSHRGS